MNPVEALAARYAGTALADGVWLFPSPEHSATFARLVRELERPAMRGMVPADWKAWSHERVAGVEHTSCDSFHCWCDE